MSDEKIVGIRLTIADYHRIEALAKMDDRKVGTYVKREMLKLLPILEAAQRESALNDPPAKYTAVKARPARPKGTRRADRN